MADRIEELLEQVHQDVIEMKVVLKGYDGNPGLCTKVDKLMTDYYKFKRLVLMIFAFMVGSGALGVSIWQIITNL